MDIVGPVTQVSPFMQHQETDGCTGIVIGCLSQTTVKLTHTFDAYQHIGVRQNRFTDIFHHTGNDHRGGIADADTFPYSVCLLSEHFTGKCFGDHCIITVLQGSVRIAFQ